VHWCVTVVGAVCKRVCVCMCVCDVNKARLACARVSKIG
jgi:hypothetical protein